MSKVKNKKKNIKATREKRQYATKKPPSGKRFFNRNFIGQESRMTFKILKAKKTLLISYPSDIKKK